MFKKTALFWKGGIPYFCSDKRLMYWIWMIFYVTFDQHAGRTKKLLKHSNIVRKQARRRCWNKAGCWRVKISVHSLSCESQADVMLFVGKLHSAHLFQIESDLVLCNATPAIQGSRQSWIRLGPRSRRWSRVFNGPQSIRDSTSGITLNSVIPLNDLLDS